MLADFGPWFVASEGCLLGGPVPGLADGRDGCHGQP